jgi:hypothetical protein
MMASSIGIPRHHAHVGLLHVGDLSEKLQIFMLTKLPSVINLSLVPPHVRSAVLHQRVLHHIITQPATPVVIWKVTPESSTVENFLDRVYSENPKALLNKIYIQYTDNDQMMWGAKAYTFWLSRLLNEIFDESSLYFHRQGMNVSIRDRTSNSHFVAVGRLLALSIIDEVPIGVNLPIGLLKLAMQSGSDTIWSDRDLETSNAPLHDEYSRIVDRVIHGSELLFPARS